MPFTFSNRLWHIIRDFDHEYTEFFLGTVKTFTGIWLLMPWDTFGSSRGTQYFTSLSPEVLWGLIFLLIGAPQFFLVLHGNNYKQRAWLSFAGMIMWILFTVLSLFGNWRGLGFIWTSLLAVSNIGIYLRLKNISDYVDQRSRASNL
jgi:hypothetical protein